MRVGALKACGARSIQGPLTGPESDLLGAKYIVIDGQSFGYIGAEISTEAVMAAYAELQAEERREAMIQAEMGLVSRAASDAARVDAIASLQRRGDIL